MTIYVRGICSYGAQQRKMALNEENNVADRPTEEKRRKKKTEQPLYQAQETRITLTAFNNVINYKAFYFCVCVCVESVKHK